MLDSAIYTTPLSFSQFQPKLYRGTYPQENNYPFLKLLQLKTIVSILPEPILEENDPDFIKFINANKINLIHITCDGKKKKNKKNKKDKDKKEKEKEKSIDEDKEHVIETQEQVEGNIEKPKKKEEEEGGKVKRRDKAVPITEQSVYDIIDIVLDTDNYPIYLHCSTGETITPIVVACLRKLSYWSSVSIVDEYIRFSGNINIHERAFIEEFDVSDFNPKMKDKARYASWIKRTQGWNSK